MVTLQELVLERQGQEFTVFAFRMDDKGEIIEYKAEDISFVSLLGYTNGNETPEETRQEGLIRDRFFNDWNPYSSGH